VIHTDYDIHNYLPKKSLLNFKKHSALENNSARKSRDRKLTEDNNRTLLNDKENYL
jgi:hypothetical protein